MPKKCGYRSEYKSQAQQRLVMSKFDKLVDSLFSKFLSSDTKEKSEKIILYVAIASFVVHLALILLTDFVDKY